MIRKICGWLILLLIAVGLYLAVAMSVGYLNAVLVFGISFAVSALMAIAVILID